VRSARLLVTVLVRFLRAEGAGSWVLLHKAVHSSFHNLFTGTKVPSLGNFLAMETIMTDRQVSKKEVFCNVGRIN
jgi:hypothetical protein